MSGRWSVNSDMENLAACVWMQRETSPGVAFARSALTEATLRVEKDNARGRILSGLSLSSFPDHLSILTFPGVNWRFEKSLLRMRDRGLANPTKTSIFALEKEPAVYAASLRFMPGQENGYSHLPGDLNCSAGTICTSKISRYHCASFEEFAAENDRVFTAAWLDFTGPISPAILTALRAFWPKVAKLLVVTSLKARWRREISDAVAACGGVPQLIASKLRGALVSSVHEYFDTVPMVQATFSRDKETVEKT